MRAIPLFTIALSMVFLVGGNAIAQLPDPSEKLAETQTMIDEEVAQIEVLQVRLEKAIDEGRNEQAESLRDQIRDAWDRIERLKDLRDYFERLEQQPKPGRSPGPPDRDRGFGKDASSTDGERATNAMLDDGDGPVSPGDVDRPESPPRRPERAGTPGERPRGRAPENARPPRPKRATPGDHRDRPGLDESEQDIAIRVIMERIEELKKWHVELIEAGELDMAAGVMELISQEKKRLVEAKRPVERAKPSAPAGETRRPRPPRDDSANDSTDEKDLRELVESMQEELERLREELRHLKEQDNGKGYSR